MERDAELVEVPEAAKLLRLSQAAIRKRIRRGSIQATKVDDRWFLTTEVIKTLQAERDAGRATGRDADGDSPQDAVRPASRDKGRAEEVGELVVELRSRIAFLEGQLELRSEELRRKDVLLATFAQRLPELPPAIHDQSPWWQRLFSRK